MSQIIAKLGRSKMFELKNYNLSENLYENKRFNIRRGVRESDNKPVIVKFLNTEYPTPEELDLFEYEYIITKNFNFSGVVKVYSLENVGHSKAMIMEDFNAVLLNKYLQSHKRDMDELLQISISLTEILGTIHKFNIIHRSINPYNIFINKKTNQLKISDFSNAINVQKEKQTLAIDNVEINSLLYISPEQTGINRSIDYRTDFYSLGVTLYEIFTGKLPFVSDDPRELILAHIAKVPARPDEVNEEIPEILSDIIMKLIEKPAEERYQSANGLKADLEECYRRLHETGSIEKFSIGGRDILERFQIPEKLYGREREIKVLFEEFKRAAGGETRIIFFCGPPGIGKSFLIHEIHKPLVEHRGYFISGKFEQYKHTIPYSAIIQAFKGLIKRLLMEPQEKLDEWKSRISKALGPNGQLIIDVIPKLELIIGKQPSILPLDPLESKNRFNLTFQNFIRIFPRPENPLVLFIDDWQWTDVGTLSLLKIMARDIELKHLLLIGAYRDNEVDASHPFIITLKEIEEEQQIEIKPLILKPLTLIHIIQLVSDTLHSSEQRIRSFAQLIEGKTRGNPFFVKQIMKSLYQDGLLQFDSEFLCWKWDLIAVKEKRVTDNVVELMVKHLKNLPENTQKVLQLASCIGNMFNLKTLSIIHEQKQSKTLEHLWKAIEEGYIVPQDENYKLIFTLKEKEVEIESRFRFLHESVKQASYLLILKEDKKAVHLKIGHLLLENTEEEELEENIFNIVNHLNQGIELITKEPERLRLGQFNLLAGRKAKASTAFNSALSYFTLGTEVLKETNWQTNYNLMLGLYKERAEAEYLNGHFEKSEELINLLLERVKTDLDKADIYSLLILQNITIAKYKEAIQVGIKALALLGIKLPITDLEKAYLVELEEVKKNLRNKEISSLVDEPEMINPEKRAAAKLEFLLGPLLYMSNYKMWRINYLNAVNLTLKYGLVPESTAAYTGYGMLLSFEFQEYKTAYEFGLLGLKISEKFNSIYHKSSACFILASYLGSWVRHIKHSISFFNEGYQAALESGNLLWASYNLCSRIMTMFYQGNTLKNVQEKLSHSLLFAQKNKNQIAVDINLGFQLAILALQGKSSGNLSFHDEKMSEAEYLESCQSHQSFMAIFNYLTAKSMILYLYGELNEALRCVRNAEKHLDFNKGLIVTAEHNFYYSLILTALYSQVSTREKGQYMKQLEANQKQMKIWADNCMENFENMYLLVEANIASISNQDNKAIELYNKAINSAIKNEFIQNEAIANELFAKFFLRKNDKEAASTYIKRAYGCYRLWGAKRKMKDLENKYPYLSVK